MLKTVLGVLIALAAAGGELGRAQAAQAAGAPRLQISRLMGRIEVSAPNRTDGVDGQEPPFLRSGSIIQVLEGSGAFDCDYHVTVRAGAGDMFQFIAIKPESSRSGALRITAIDREPKAILVSVGDQKFRLGKGGALSITSIWPGELVVRSDSRGVQHAPGSLAKDGTITVKARAMTTGETVVVAVPEEPGFESAAISTAALYVTRANDANYLAEANWPAERSQLSRDEEARRVIASWPVVSLRTAEAIIEKYGPPDLAVSERLTWNNNGIWKMTSVYRNPHLQEDILEQAISYKVPREKLAALERLDVALRLSRDGKELSATSESEETNILALNLADEVVRGVKSPQEAREFYIKTVLLANAGKTSPYLRGLLFR